MSSFNPLLYDLRKRLDLQHGCRVVLLNYREDGITPYVTVWKYGLTEEKV